MNVYDFDNTIFSGDSTFRFFKFTLFRHPKVACYLPRIIYSAVKYYVLHIGTKTQFKERMYTFLKACDTAKDTVDFWKQDITRIKPFYKENHREDDVIISASPEFLLKPLERILGFTVIASRVSPADGKTDGENCYNEEKLRRFKEIYPDGEINEFYSDSYSDEPLALIARSAYIVKGQIISEWDFNKHKKRLRT